MSVSFRFALFAAVAALLAALALFSVDRGKAAPFAISFPTGQVCANSAVNVVFSDPGHQVSKQFTRPNGTVRALSAGKGSDLVFYNPNHPSDTVSLKGNGTVAWTTLNSDGGWTTTLTGHWVIFYFPTDTMLGGPGPATLLVVGREVYRSDAAFNFTQISESGNVTDICSLLPAD